MKKTILTLTLLVFVLALAACGGTAAEPEVASPATSGDTTTDNGNTASNTSNGDGEFSMPTETFLMLGTVMLDETEYAVDADQASMLLPLWKALRSLGESETTAQAELDAVIAQIEDTMTPEQISAVEAMELTMQDMAGVAEILGIEIDGLGAGFGERTPEMQATMEAARESGELPGGGPGGGLGLGGGQGRGGQGGAEMDPAARETAIAERGGTRGARSGINTFLLDAIIEFLETKSQ